MSTKLSGFQILYLDGKRVKDFGADEVLPLTYCLRWIRNEPHPDMSGFALLPIFKGDIQNPKFPHGNSSLDIRV